MKKRKTLGEKQLCYIFNLEVNLKMVRLKFSPGRRELLEKTKLNKDCEFELKNSKEGQCFKFLTIPAIFVISLILPNTISLGTTPVEVVTLHETPPTPWWNDPEATPDERKRTRIVKYVKPLIFNLNQFCY